MSVEFEWTWFILNFKKDKNAIKISQKDWAEELRDVLDLSGAQNGRPTKTIGGVRKRGVISIAEGQSIQEIDERRKGSVKSRWDDGIRDAVKCSEKTQADKNSVLTIFSDSLSDILNYEQNWTLIPQQRWCWLCILIDARVIIRG